MEKIFIPKIIQQYIQNMTCIKDTVGRTDSSVYCFTNSKNTMYLKIEKENMEFEHEQSIMQWLQGRLPVPQIVAQHKEHGYSYVLMSKVLGEMACSEQYINNPETLVRLLAKGITILQKVDISDCSFDCTLKNKLAIAGERIINNKIDSSDWEANTSYKSPYELYSYLFNNRPNEELVFSHGDYCMPNIFLHNEMVSGFIDLGRAGIGDKWQDIALCVRSLEHKFKNIRYVDLLFKYLDIEPNWEKIKYYILLDELF